MSAVPTRSFGHHPETKILCDWKGGECPNNAKPPSDWHAEDARRAARIAGWAHVGNKDYCPDHTP